ncbi:FIG00741759: hypothetical protein [hydrothermal vent metagenome]|uniref:Uncharacterized protein n=1 Tax=hydrothermal vent metagenome TaxID=652676 RepID=A0A3B0RDF1_9ZZZZ
MMALPHFIKAGIFLLVSGFFWTISSAAMAQQAVDISTENGSGYGRILFAWPQDDAGKNLQVDANISNGVLVIRFNELLSAQPKLIRDGLPNYVALARMDADGQTIRIALRKPAELKTSKSFNVFAIDLIAPNSGVTPPKLVSPLAKRQAEQQQAAHQRAEAELQKAKRLARSNPALPLLVRFATSSDNTRISFDWTESVEFRVLDREDGLDLIFDRAAAPALAELNASQPLGLMSASSLVRKNKTIISINKVPGFSHRTSRDGTHVALDIFQQAQQPQLAHAEVEPEPEPVVFVPTVRQNPIPKSGRIPIKVTASSTALQLTFDWAAPVGATAFMRGDALWIIFDAKVQIDLSELREGGNRHALSRKLIEGSNYSGVWIRLPASTQVEARPNADGSSWSFILDDKLEYPTTQIDLRREADGSGPGRLAAKLKNAQTMLWVKDKEVGDTLLVVTSFGPATGIAGIRRFVEVSALPSSQGLAFEINADGLDIKLDDDLLSINSERGLNLTPSATPLQISANPGHSSKLAAMPAITASPGFIDFESWKKLGGEGVFHETYSALLRRVAIEDTDPEARMILAKFLIANGMGAEALGALSLAQSLDPMLVQDARFRALRGAANVQMHRIKAATADFGAQTLNRDPAAALWRGWLAAQTENWTDARQNFEKGREAIYLFNPEWQAKFHTAFAEAAMNLNDLGTTQAQLREVLGNGLSLPTQLEANMVRAELLSRTDETKRALSILDNIIATNYEPMAVRAIYQKTNIQRTNNTLTPLEATNILENLRFRWRGDAVELESVRALGSFYSEAGDFRRAMEAMSLAIKRFPDSPVARRLQADLNKTFLDLFLDGGADSMDPVQAVALFYEFQDFTPLGADGDRMLRRMADRLIAFDLLPQASELLQYQVDQKLFGLGKAQVATDLALVYLMDHRPEKALRAIHSSRQARLPRALNQERRLLEARALVELGRSEHATDLIEMDRTRAADFLRADIVWAGKDWSKISPQLQATVARRVHNTDELLDDEASLILRATIASALDDDKTGFQTLVDTWQQPMAKSSFAEAFRLISSQTSLSGVEVKDLARTIGATDTMRSYLDQYRTRVARRPQTAQADIVAKNEG